MSEPIQPLYYDTPGKVFQNTDVDPLSQYSHLKTGWPVNAFIDDVDITVNSGNLTVVIAPQSDDVEYWIAGNRYVLDDTENVTWNDVEGSWFFYFTQNGLESSQTPWGLDDTKALVAALYWDATNNDVITWSPETHSWIIPDRLHSYLHRTFGTRWDSGLGVTLNTSNIHLDIGNGVIYDEDQKTSIYDTGGSSKWVQALKPVDAQKEYKLGASGEWRRTTSNTSPVILSSNVPQVNTWNGTEWVLQDVSSGNYFAMWVVAVTSPDGPVYMLTGQYESSSQSEAEENNTLYNLDTNSLAAQEHKVLARIILKSEAASPYYSVVAINDYRIVVDEQPASGGTPATSDHGGLTGLLDDDHTQYVLADGTRNVTGNMTFEADVQIDGTLNASNYPAPLLPDTVLTTNGTTIVEWVSQPSTWDWPASTAANQLLVGDTDNTPAWLSTANDSVLTTNATGVISWDSKPDSWTITSTQITNWDTAYGWGDHAGLYDPAGTANSAVSTHESTYNHAHYDTAYGWGDHAGLYDPAGTAASEVSTHESTYNHDAFGLSLAAPSTANLIYQSTGNATGAWTDTITGLTSVTSGLITIAGNQITASGTIDFDDENLWTTGWIKVGNWTIPNGSASANSVFITTTANTAYWLASNTDSVLTTNANGDIVWDLKPWFWEESGPSTGGKVWLSSDLNNAYWTGGSGNVTKELLVAQFGLAAWAEAGYGVELEAPTADNQIYQSTGNNAGAWTTDIEGLTSLEVDNLTIDGDELSSTSGYVVIRDQVIAGDDTVYPDTGMTISYDISSPDTYAFALAVRGTYASDVNTVYGMYFRPRLEPANNRSAYGCEYTPIIDTDISNTISYAVSQRCSALTMEGTGTIVRAVGLWISEQTVGTFNYGIYVDGGNCKMRDNSKWLFGDGDDSSMYYDGSDMIADPKEAGSGAFKILGDLVVEGIFVSDNIQIDGSDVGRIMGENKTIYLRTGGSDSNGGYASGDAFLTPSRVIQELYRWIADGYTITVDVGEGEFSTGELDPAYAYGSNVSWEGVYDTYSTCDVTNIDGSATTEGSGLAYIDFDVTLPVGETASVGDFVLVKESSGGTNPELVQGCHEIQAWDGGTRKATCRCYRRDGASKLPSGAITADTIDVVRSYFTFTASKGIAVNGAYSAGNWDGIVISGDASATSYGIWMQGGATIQLNSHFGIHGFQHCMYAQNNGSILADYVVASKATGAIIVCNNGGICSFRYGAIGNGSALRGAQIFNSSQLNAYQARFYCYGNQQGIICYKGSFVDFDNGMLSGPYDSGTVGLTVLSGGGIVSTSVTADNVTVRNTPSGTGGAGAYHSY